MYRYLFLSVVVVALGMMGGCRVAREYEITPEPVKPEAYKDGSAAGRSIQFSGWNWLVKKGRGYVGPGPNLFSSSSDNVWVDKQGRLHLKIEHTDAGWTCAEVVAEKPAEYGTYRFYTSTRLDALDPNVVLGFFTWDDQAYETMANCEIDIEWSRWTDPSARNLHYSVQPAWGPDESDGRYAERTHALHVDVPLPSCLDIFDWRESGVHFRTYEGHKEKPDALIAEWVFDANNPARRTAAGGRITQPIVIPKPGPHTHIRINLWLVDGDRSGQGDAPQNGLPCEVVIDRFEFEPEK